MKKIPYEIGKAKIRKTGTDLTIVSYSKTMLTVEKAAEKLEEEGISAEVINLVTLSPWDKETVLRSVQKTGRLIIAHEAVKQGGFGGEIAATVAEEGFCYLKAPISRIAAPFVPVPFAPELEEQVRVHVEDIVNKAKELIHEDK